MNMFAVQTHFPELFQQVMVGEPLHGIYRLMVNREMKHGAFQPGLGLLAEVETLDS